MGPPSRQPPQPAWIGQERFCETGRLKPGSLSEPRDESRAEGGRGRVVSWAQRRLAPARSHVHSWPGGHHLWRVAIALVGLAVVVAGIVMLVVPGPGWLVIFLGIAIWSTEFPWANSVAIFVRRRIASCVSWIRRQPRWLLVAVGLVCVALVVAIALLAYVASR